MVLADNTAPLALGGAAAAAVAIFAAIFLPLLIRWLDHRDAENKEQSAQRDADNKIALERHQADVQASLAGVKLSQDALSDGLSWTEKHNRELRTDLAAAEAKLDAAESKIDALQGENAALRNECAELRSLVSSNEAECRRRLAALEQRIQEQGGPG